MNIVVFEDGLHDHFYPLSSTRPLWELRSGLYSFRERIEVSARKMIGSGCSFYYFTRDYLAPYYREKYPQLSINDPSVFEQDGEIMFLNAVTYPSESDFDLSMNLLMMRDGVPVCARVNSSRISDAQKPVPEMIAGLDLDRSEYTEDAAVSGRKADYIWDLVDWNRDTLESDWRLSGLKGKAFRQKDVTILGERGLVYIDEGVSVDPYVVIDASQGPIVIGAGSAVKSFTRIEGPCAIGRECTILGAKLRAGCSIGNSCRIGGEVEQSIFQGYANKYHDGFIGHSYIGEWVNLGALTTNSDLKNDYSNVKVYTPRSRKKTGRKKIGCFIGDFVKTSIGTLINTGTSIGAGAMVVHDGNLTPAHVHPFVWYMNSSEYRMQSNEDFVATCRTVASRRNVDLPDSFINLISALYTMAVEGET
jgi:UDP-N-acetylglucosamine diphosphorylase/glucosamine-1-phosphate N-acetyltransferase